MFAHRPGGPLLVPLQFETPPQIGCGPPLVRALQRHHIEILGVGVDVVVLVQLVVRLPFHSHQPELNIKVQCY